MITAATVAGAVVPAAALADFSDNGLKYYALTGIGDGLAKNSSSTTKTTKTTYCPGRTYTVKFTLKNDGYRGVTRGFRAPKRVYENVRLYLGTRKGLTITKPPSGSVKAPDTWLDGKRDKEGIRYWRTKIFRLAAGATRTFRFTLKLNAGAKSTNAQLVALYASDQVEDTQHGGTLNPAMVEGTDVSVLQSNGYLIPVSKRC
ncbi:hypothetical protein AB0L40_00615 [Patulibacter sp. NPDC049589]|uniref:hypothetical protein n=1 Tax=Patulibacter sp. NPDC049589 TaxID=3154731 RepID=UPI003413CB08